MGVDNKRYNEKITVKRDQNIQSKNLVFGNLLLLMIYYNLLNQIEKCYYIIFMIVQTCNPPKITCMVFIFVKDRLINSTSNTQ